MRRASASRRAAHLDRRCAAARRRRPRAVLPRCADDAPRPAVHLGGRGAGTSLPCRAPARDSMEDEISDSIDGGMLNVKRNHTETSRRGRRCDGCATTPVPPPPTAPTLCRPLRCPRVSRAVVLRSGVSTRVESGRAAVGRHAHCVEASMVTTRGAVAAVIAGSRPRALFGNDLRLRSSRTRLLGPGSSLVSDRVSVSPLAHPPHFLGSSRVDAGLASNSFCKVALASVTPSLSRVRGILFHHQRAAHTILSSSLLS